MWRSAARSRQPWFARPDAIDVLAQHVLGTACASSFDPDQLYREVVSASPYQGLTREGFDKVVEFVATGSYALAIYEGYAKLKRALDGRYRIAHARIA
jgi:ATP-dependent helicase Lhr and Lhr-like helicase